MEIVDRIDVLHTGDILGYGRQTGLDWRGLHEHADAMSKGNSGSVEHNDGEQIGANGVEVPQSAVSQVNDQTGNQNTDGVENVAEDVQIRSLHIQVAFSLGALFLK